MGELGFSSYSSLNSGAVISEVRIELNKISSDLAQLESLFRKTLGKIEAESDQTANKTSAVWQAAMNVAGFYYTRVAKMAIDGFKKLVTVYGQFEQSLANTQSVARASAEELKMMEENARRVGATTRSTASQAANALYYLASAGFTATEAVAALDGVNALAIATQSDLARTSEFIATTIRQYQLETHEATRAANVYTAAITSSLATLDKLRLSMQYVGPAAAGLNMSLEETVGVLEVLYNKGFSGEKAGRALRGILVDLADSTSVTIRKLEHLGVSFDEVNPATHRFSDVIQRLKEANVDATNAAAIFGKVSGVQMASLLAVGKDEIDRMTKAVTGTNRAFEAMDIQMDTLFGSFDQFKNAVEAIRIGAGKSLETTFRSITDDLTTLLRYVAALPPFLLALGTVSISTAGALSLLTGALIALKVTTFAVAAPVVALLTGVAAAIVGIVEIDKQIKINRVEAYAEQFPLLTANVEDALGAHSRLKRAVDTFTGITGKALVNNIVDLKNKDEQIDFLRQVASMYKVSVNVISELINQNKFLTQTQKDLVASLASEISVYEARIASHLNFAEVMRQENALLERNKTIAEEKQNALNEVHFNLLVSGIDALKLAFQRADEYVKLLGDDFDRNAYITKEYERVIKNFIDGGLTAESDYVKSLVALYKELQEQKGFVFSKGMSDREFNVKAIDETTKAIKRLQEQAELYKNQGLDFDIEREQSDYILKTIQEYLERGFTFNGPGLQQFLSLFGQYIVGGATAIEQQDELNKLLESYEKQLESIALTQDRLLQKELETMEARFVGNEEALGTIRAYFALKKYLLQEEEKQEQKAIQDKIVRQFSDNTKFRERLALHREQIDLAIEEYRTTKATAEEIERIIMLSEIWYEKMKSQEISKEIDNIAKEYKNITAVLSDLIVAFNSLTVQQMQNSLTELDKWKETATEAVDEWLDATLIAQGLMEETTLQRLRRELDEAILAGNEELIATKQREYDKEKILQEATDKKKAIEEEFANKKKLLDYDLALNEWKMNKMRAAFEAPLVVLKAIKAGFDMFGLGGGIIGGLLGTAQTVTQIAAIDMAKPQPPQFETGGIVPGTNFRGDKVLARLNSGEEVLRRDDPRHRYNSGFVRVEIPVILGDVEVAKVVADVFNDGRVTLNSKRALR